MFRGLLSASSLSPALRLCVSAGTLLDPALADQFREKFHRKIHSFYGTTECGGICFDGSPDRQSEPGFIGQPLAGVAIEVPSHPEGAKICVRSAAIGGCPAAPACQPSDLLVRQADGFRLVGRDSDWINVAGKKVSPAEVERVVGRFPGVSDVLVCGVENSWRGEEICALIAAATPIDRTALRQHCAALIAAWKCPRRFEFRAAIPEGPTGRINRIEARQIFSHPTREGFLSYPPEKTVMNSQP
jgi:long-chain acyl-CoA synthetase